MSYLLCYSALRMKIACFTWENFASQDLTEEERLKLAAETQERHLDLIEVEYFYNRKGSVNYLRNPPDIGPLVDQRH
jgi:hypothetical protein